MKKFNAIKSCCYFPTTVALLSNDDLFLQALKLKLQGDYLLHCDTNLKQAFEEIKKNSCQSGFLNHALNRLLNWSNALGEDIYYTLRVNFSEIYQQIYDQNRFNNITVAVVDYAMPVTNSLDFCRQLKNYPIKKIMVGGKVDYPMAVNAFNEGIIDKFIVKNTSTVFNDIHKAIAEMQACYFSQLSQRIVTNILLVVDDAPITCENYGHFFDKLCHRHKICEYYLLDHLGSYLLIDNAANAIWIIVSSIKELNDYLKIAIDHNAPDNIITDLKNRRKIPFFFTKHDYYLAVDQWHHRLFSAKLVPGSHHYYYAFERENAIGNLDKKRLVSYRDFLNKLTT